MAFNKSERPDAPARRRGGMRRRKKVCVFCGKDNVIDYKDTNKLKRYVSERDVYKRQAQGLEEAFPAARRGKRSGNRAG